MSGKMMYIFKVTIKAASMRIVKVDYAYSI